MKEISDIRDDELDAISKSLSVSDNGQLSSHGSLEGEEDSSIGKKGVKVLNNLKSSSSSSSSSLPSTITTTATPSTSSSSSVCEENGIHDESEINMEEHLDPTLLKNMSKTEFMSHYKNEITELKRNYELKIHDMTEQHFSHMRELLREREPSLTIKKNKEFDMLRRRNSEVISKVDENFVEDDEVAALLPHTFGSNEESLSSLKDRLESLLSENHQLRDLLEDKKREIKCLRDEEDLNMEFIIMQEVCDVIFKDSLKDAEEKLNNLNNKYIDQYELQVLHEMEKQEKQKQLEVEIANKERLKQEVLFLVQEKEQLARDAVAAWAIVQERYEVDAQELENLRGETCQQQKLISERVEESNAAKRDLAEALEQIERHKVDMCKLERILEVAAQELENFRGETCQQKKLISESVEESNAAKRDLVKALEQIERHKVDICKLERNFQGAMTKLREVDEHRRMLLDANQQKQIAVSLFEEKERELRKQFETMSVYVGGLLKAVTDFESRVTQDISGKCSRLKSLTSQLHLLKQKADVLVRQGLLYKHRLEKKCSDLEKAEAEVDLLGDKVDTLMNLAEKIYIGLDHYSPILQHYPGITEILKLLRRELSAEIKSV